MSSEKIDSQTSPSTLDKIIYFLRPLILDYKRYLVFFIPLAALVLSFFVYKAVRYTDAGSDAAHAKASYNQWVAKKGSEEAHFSNLKNLIKKRPELAPAYEGPIVQRLLASGAISKSKPFTENLLRRVGQRSSYYTKFSRVSLLIAEKNYPLALKKAKSLKEDMIADKSFWSNQAKYFGSKLFAFNLLRIATLNQVLGQYDDELLSWNELKSYAKWDTSSNGERPLEIDQVVFDELLSHFTEEKMNLKDYIKHREEVIGTRKNT